MAVVKKTIKQRKVRNLFISKSLNNAVTVNQRVLKTVDETIYIQKIQFIANAAAIYNPLPKHCIKLFVHNQLQQLQQQELLQLQLQQNRVNMKNYTIFQTNSETFIFNMKCK